MLTSSEVLETLRIIFQQQRHHLGTFMAFCNAKSSYRLSIFSWVFKLAKVDGAYKEEILEFFHSIIE